MKSLLAVAIVGCGVATASAINHRAAAPAPSATPTSVVTTSGATNSATLVSNHVTTSKVVAVSGTVMAVSGSSISIRTTTGLLSTYSVTSATVVMQGRAKTTIALVTAGTHVFVVPSATSPTTAAAIGIVASSHGHEGSDGAGSDGGASSYDN